MAHPTIDPTLGPVLARTGDERVILDAFLDFHRANVLRKARGLTDAAARRLVPSLTTLAGLLKHLTLVERNWFRCLFAPEPGDVYVTSQADADASFTLRPGDTVEGLAAAYEAACDRSRRIAARFDLDTWCRTRSSVRCRCAGCWCT